MNLRLLRQQVTVAGLPGDRGLTLAGMSVVCAVLLSGCGSTTPSPAPTVTVTKTPSVQVVTFNPATSGKVLAARIATRAKTAGMKVTAVECKNFPDINVGTVTNCQMQVKGVKEGLRATFTLRQGHYVLKAQKLTW